MSFADELLKKYASARESFAPPRVRLIHRKSTRLTEPVSPDLRKLSGELLRLAKPSIDREGVRIFAGLKAAQHRGARELQVRLNRDLEHADQLRRKELPRFFKKLDRSGEKIVEYMRSEGELILARAARARERENNRASVAEPADFMSDSKIEQAIDERLERALEELKADALQTAREESRAAISRLREEERYNALRWGR